MAELWEIIQKSKRICFFGGAGVSTESGIPDFRSSKGIYSQDYGGLPPEEILSHSFFIKKPELFYRFYREKMIFTQAKPNGAHYALAYLEEKGVLNAVVTQNIDGLHQAAGSKNVIELHGSVYRNFCMGCGEYYSLEYVMSSEGVPRCEKCGGLVRPDVVLYEESLDSEVIERAVNSIQSADTLIIGGTSLAVYPAAGLIRYFRGDDLVVINKSPTFADSYATLVINGSIAKSLSEAVNNKTSGDGTS
ncbi:MAG TPA: NAD-dependent protein deacylase [Candidatus Avimonas sp.]|nr:NAD-dependent protein deacylase [Candidatus Avimonas sp.]